MNTCPYCLDPISETDEYVICDSCGTRHHLECWKENGGCCIRDCKKVCRQIDVEINEDKPTVLTLSRESIESAVSRRKARSLNPCIKCGRQVPEGELYCPDCVPEIQENQDAKNLGPLLIMIGIVVLVLVWMVITMVAPQANSGLSPIKTETGIHTK